MLGQALLARKAKVVVPGVAQEQRIGGLGVRGEIRIAQDEIGELREARAARWDPRC